MPDVTWTGGITELKKIADAGRGLLHADLAARRRRPDQRPRRRARDDDGAELLPARDLALGPQRLQRADAHAARQLERRAEAAAGARARHRAEPRLPRSQQSSIETA